MARLHTSPTVELYDTTLRDGSQQEGIQLSVKDKLALTHEFDLAGIDLIEGGWPGANPVDTEFFAQATTDLKLTNAQLVAFGATRKAGLAAADDPQVRALLDADTKIITLVAKSHVRHVELALRTDLDENLRMIADTVEFLHGEGREVIVDMEHFFDGYLRDPDFSRRCLAAAADAGARVIVMCDTNGGMLPHQVGEITAAARTEIDTPLGIHCHNDTGCAAANSVEAVRHGAAQVHGTINGYGERTGNADLITVIANLQLKLGYDVLSETQLADLTRVAHAVGEIVNIAPFARAPYVGASAFTHKAGLHASAVRIDPDLYQHTQPERLGNEMRTLVSSMAGGASIELKARELGLDLARQPEQQKRIAAVVKAHEAEGYSYEAADASLELLMHRELHGTPLTYCEVESWRVITEERDGGTASDSTVKISVGGQRIVANGEGNGPVNALDMALRSALKGPYPQVDEMELVDYKVRILDSSMGSDAVTRVLVETADGQTSWSTIGVGTNVVEASWIAILDALSYGLMRRGA